MTVQFSPKYKSTNSIKSWLVKWMSKELFLPESQIYTSNSLLEYNLNSMTAMMLVGDLEEWLKIEIIPTLVWDYPSIDALAQYLAEEANTANNDSKIKEKEATQELSNFYLIDQTNVQEMSANLNELSEEEIDALLGDLLK